MAITYPRPIPSFIKGIETRFDLEEATSDSATLGNIPLATQLRDPRWVFSVKTQPLSANEADQMAAWWETLRGGGKSFLATDMRRNFPINYPGGVSSLVRAGGGAFNGTAKAAAIATNSLTVGMAAGFLPAAFVFKAGDKVGLVSTASPVKYSVHRVLEDATANGSGVVVLNIYPFIATSRFAVGDVVNLVKPLAEFIPDRESWSRETMSAKTPISFSGRSRGY
jgi:hypothetical protein